MKIDSTLLRKIVEGALLASDAPLSVAKLAGLFEPSEGSEPEDVPDEKPSKDEILAVLQDIQADCQGRGYELKEVGSGWRFQVVQETASWVNRLWEEKPQKYSRALLETLALIAYRQPITRGDIESIRGVAVSSTIIKTLTEREWVKVVGHRDVPGRPALYATTRQFLDYFNLKSLDELPSLKEIQDFDKLDSELGFPRGEDGETAGAPEPEGAEGGIPDGAESAAAIASDEEQHSLEVKVLEVDALSVEAPDVEAGEQEGEIAQTFDDQTLEELDAEPAESQESVEVEAEGETNEAETSPPVDTLAEDDESDRESNPTKLHE